MPTYDYACTKCGRKFAVTHPITDHPAKAARCPRCASRKVQRRITPFFAKTSKKS